MLDAFPLAVRFPAAAIVESVGSLMVTGSMPRVSLPETPPLTPPSPD
jgi:hypothetical protein